MNRINTSWWHWNWLNLDGVREFGRILFDQGNPLILISPEWSRVICFVLLHSLWQGVLLASLLWVLLRAMPARRSTVRYALASVSLLMLVLTSFVTGSVLNLYASQRVDLSTLKSAAVGGSAVERSSPPQALIDPIGSELGHGSMSDQPRLDRVHPDHTALDAETSRSDIQVIPSMLTVGWTQWLYRGWLLGVLIMLIRMGLALIQTRRIVRESRPLTEELAGPLQSLVDELRRALRVSQRVTLACSDRLKVPAVCGVLWPVLLVPTAMLTGISVEQWRVILAHELAHVRRHDYVLNIVQMLIESLYFFNPAVWWISRQIRAEREACCDALAIQVTGQPLLVARTLVQVADLVCRGQSSNLPKALVAWQAVDGNQEPGELSERVRRIALPDRLPRLKMPWYSLLGVLVTSCLVLMCLQLGADAAVKAVAQILSPRERVKKLIELERDLVDASSSDSAIGPAESKTKAKSLGPTQVTGRISTAAGEAIPGPVHVRSIEFRKNSSTHSSLDVTLHAAKNEMDRTNTLPGESANSAREKKKTPGGPLGEFKLKYTAPSTLFIVGELAGFAPTIVGPIVTQVDQELAPPSLVFDRGFPATIRLVDPDLTPISGASVSASISIRYGTSTAGTSGFPTLKSDAQGLIQIEHAQSAFPYDVKFEAAGFQLSQRLITFQPGQSVEWKIPRAKITRGRMVSDATGLPVADAELFLVEARTEPLPGHTSSWGPGDPRAASANRSVLAKTNADGRFELDRLADGVIYRLYVRSQEHRPYLLEEIVAGEELPEIRLLPPLIVKGTILGINRLPKQFGDTDGNRKLYYGNVLRSAGRGTTYSSALPFTVTIVKGVGRFEMRELIPGPLTLRLGARQEELQLQESVLDWVIDLNQEPKRSEPTARRRVVFELTGLAEPEAVSGKLQLSWQGSGIPFNQELVSIQAGRAEVEVPIGASVSVSGRSLIGCWLEQTSAVLIQAGAEPLKVDLAAVPAGAIQGRVFNSDGTQCDNFDISVVMSKTPDLLKGQSFLGVEARETVPGSFLFQQLPFGGEYRILIRSKSAGSLATLLSAPIGIQEETPIQSIDLRFIKRKALVVRVVDTHQNPVSQAGLEIKYSVSGDRVSHGFGRAFMTDERGIATIPDLNWETSSDIRIQIPPTKTLQGQSIKLEPGMDEVAIEMKRGVVASGVVINAETGRPLAHTEIRLGPADYSQPGYLDWFAIKTNAQGEFHVMNLEPRAYRINLDHADPVGTEYTRQPGGGYSIKWTREFPTIEGGSPTPIKIEVQLRPDSPGK